MELNVPALETSFDLVAPHGEQLMDEFYAQLFKTAPAVVPLFAATDLQRQKTKLLSTLVLVRNSLRDLNAIVPNLRKLGARHVAYGAQPEHYSAVGETLIAAMATIAGTAWLSEHESAWRDAFAAVAAAMLDGAKAASPRQPHREPPAEVTVKNGYVLAGVDAATEAGRLALLEQRFDTGTIRRFTDLGVTSGWRCLEVGAGHGSIARWLSRKVGPTGSVVAADIDTRFLTGLPDNVDVRELDVRDLELEPEFDLVHCRALLMHLPDPADVLARIVAALRPGGVVLAEEGDFGLLHFGGHPNSAAQNGAHQKILNAMREARIMDGYFGRKLPEMLLARGLELQFAEIDAATGRAGEPEYEWMRTTMVEVAAKLVAAEVIDAATRRMVEEFFSTSGTVVTSVSLVAAGGRKPR